MARSAWKDDYYWKCYRFALNGHSDKEIARLIKVHPDTYNKWKKENPVFARGMRAARKEVKRRQEGPPFKDFFYGRLSGKNQKLWDKMDLLDSPGNLEKYRELLDSSGKETRQMFWLHCWFECNFSKSEACRRLGISHHTITLWKRDPEFVELLNGMEDVKKDFFESHLVALVAGGDPSATTMANRTLNRDRGYGAQLEVTAVGSIEHHHQHELVLPFEELKLPLDVKVKVLEAYRVYKEEKAVDAAKRVKAEAV